MNLYQLSASAHGKERIVDFLKDNFISIGWAGLGDLEGIDRQELKTKIAAAYRIEGERLADCTEHISQFIHSMQDGDWVVIAHQDTVYLGDIGDYFYDETFDNEEVGLCHKRGVTWLAKIPRVKLNESLQRLLASEEAISKFKYPLEQAELDQWIVNPQHGGAGAGRQDQGEHKGQEQQMGKQLQVPVDEATIEEALAILKQALRCGDPDRQERAAAAILHYAKQ
ncbi:hypothetical protein EBB07_23060 [Paenibacillaceae bacterium]|nr:hypothetical protein EBB07_23060 [Paenibacillaceae bacterium]